MDKWEYKVVTLIETDINDLNKLGNDGWEICATVSRNHGYHTMYLKRKL